MYIDDYFFFFKQKTAYEMRISDWSSDACSSDLNSYQSAFSHYLAGFVYEALGERDLAAPGYRKAAELRPNTPRLEQALIHLDKHAAQQDESDIPIVVQSGLAPSRASLRIPLNVPLTVHVVITTLLAGMVSVRER